MVILPGSLWKFQQILLGIGLRASGTGGGGGGRQWTHAVDLNMINSQAVNVIPSSHSLSQMSDRSDEKGMEQGELSKTFCFVSF